MKTRKPTTKALLSLVGIIALTLIINSYMKENEKEIDFPGILYGIPTYQNSRLSLPMSSLEGDPYIAVFLSRHPYEKVLQFYKEKLQMDYKVLKYGLRKHITKRVYQFEMEKGVLKDYINKGVEIIPLNSRSQRVYKARTKIKIIIPRKEVAAISEKKETTNR
ncbi:MAG: hypothetical protein JSV88_32215 [Candidatus Aminicenantes bacterium]|nr:MAG: hypothetical protein JSV88_32215 [Candidatus Aminicenantes bacterium]